MFSDTCLTARRPFAGGRVGGGYQARDESINQKYDRLIAEMDPDAIDSLFGTSSRADVTDSGPSGSRHRRSTTSVRVGEDNVSDPQLLDFSSCTNPSIPSGAVQVYQSSFAAARSRATDVYCEFRVTAAEYVGCEPRQVIPTPGGLAAIRLTIATTVGVDDRVLLPAPSTGTYEREVELQGASVTRVSIPELLEADPEQYELVIAATPNNPTGEAYDPRTLSAFADRCREAGTPLLLDERFLPFTELPSLAGRDGVIVVRSLSNVFGFPGLRVGFAVATGPHRDRLDVSRLARWIGTPAVELGVYCMGQTGFLRETRERVRSERRRMIGHLDERFDVIPSRAPFLLLDAGSSERVDDVLARARTRGIDVCDARRFDGLDSHVRVSVRRPEENDQLLAALTGV